MTPVSLPATSSAEFRKLVAEREWYHTIDLGNEIVTPGFFDHRSVAGRVLPPSLAGQRCLDLATFDGFWANEMVRRGAEEVVAVDVPDPRDWDWPSGVDEQTKVAVSARKGEGDGFDIVMHALNRQVERVASSVYDLDPAVIGQFDFVYVGSLLLHLRDPIRALERVREVCRGELRLVENVDPVMSLLHRRRPVATLEAISRPWWWRLNLAALLRAVESAGFVLSGPPQRLRFPRGRGRPVPRLSLATLRHSAMRTEFREAVFGDSHVVLVARPRV